MNVVRDSDELTVLYLGPGARYQMPDRIAALSPQQRHSPATWALRAVGDWELVEQSWRSTHVLTFLYPHKYFSIRMFFAEGDWRHLCWYVNFQRPFVRTEIGFDALDLALDIVVPAHDINARIVKDEEQYLAGVEQGGISNKEAAAIASARTELVDVNALRFEPFVSEWRSWRPPEGWPAQIVPPHDGTIGDGSVRVATTACSRRPSQSSNLHTQICRLSGARLMLAVRRPMPISRQNLDAIVRDGLAHDIFRAERAIALLQASGTRAGQINSGAGNYGELFGALQAALTTEAVLAIARLFDKPSKHFPTRSIKGVLAYLALRHDELPSIGEIHQLELSLSAMKVPKKILAIVREKPLMFAPEFAEFMRASLNRGGRAEALKLLRTIRDKTLAHNEHVVDLKGPTWNALIDLTDLAKQVVGVIGWAYLSTAYTPNGEYGLTEDAVRPSRALTRLLDALYEPPSVA